MRKAVTFGTLAVLAIAATAAWQYQHNVNEAQAGLLARAAVAPDVARATALASVRGGHVIESELEAEADRADDDDDSASG